MEPKKNMISIFIAIQVTCLHFHVKVSIQMIYQEFVYSIALCANYLVHHRNVYLNHAKNFYKNVAKE